MPQAPRWPLAVSAGLVILVALLMTGCAGILPARYKKLPSGSVAYPGFNYSIGRVGFHQLHSILPGERKFECATKTRVFSTLRPGIEVASCFLGSEEQMRAIADAVARSFSFLEASSQGNMRFCNVTVALVAFEDGLTARDTQSLKACPRVKLVARWEPGFSDEQNRKAIDTIVRHTAHEAYHIIMWRWGQRSHARLLEETEAALVARCASRAALGERAENLDKDGARPLPMEFVGAHYHESIEGGAIAGQLLKAGKAQEIAAAAPAGKSRALITACADTLAIGDSR